MGPASNITINCLSFGEVFQVAQSQLGDFSVIPIPRRVRADFPAGKKAIVTGIVLDKSIPNETKPQAPKRAFLRRLRPKDGLASAQQSANTSRALSLLRLRGPISNSVRRSQ